MLYYGIYAFQKGLKQGVIAIICQEKTRRRHRREELQKFRRSRGAQILEVCSDVVDDSQQRRVYCGEFALACSDDVVNGLLRISAYSVSFIRPDLRE